MISIDLKVNGLVHPVYVDTGNAKDAKNWPKLMGKFTSLAGYS